MTVNVGTTVVTTEYTYVTMWNDTVTAAKNNGTIICAQNVTVVVKTAPSATANSTMYSKITYATTSST